MLFTRLLFLPLPCFKSMWNYHAFNSWLLTLSLSKWHYFYYYKLALCAMAFWSLKGPILLLLNCGTLAKSLNFSQPCFICQMEIIICLLYIFVKLNYWIKFLLRISYVLVARASLQIQPPMNNVFWNCTPLTYWRWTALWCAFDTISILKRGWELRDYFKKDKDYPAKARKVI